MSRGRILIMAGGTGGHVFPALSIARELERQGMEVEWLGTRQGLEARVIPEAGLPLHLIRIGGLRGKGLVTKALAPLRITLAVLQSVITLLRLRPDCVLGMGGFVTGPGGVAAWLLRRPLVIHEQNAIAGFSNQMLQPLAQTVLEAFPGAFVHKHTRTRQRWLRAWGRPRLSIVTGNPVRVEIATLPAPQERLASRQGPLRLLVLGGSLGAVALNELIPALVAEFDAAARPRVWHQCGSRHLEDTRSAYREQGLEPGDELRVDAFIEDMAAAYAWADLVVCRAGALTIAELAAAGLPAVLVPYPYAVDDHQAANANYLVEVGAAVMLRQDALDHASLRAALKPWLEDKEARLRAASAARARALPEATATVARYCLEACHG